MATHKLVVQVVNACGLMAKGGQGSVSACVEVNFNGQRFCTAVKEKDLNPVWNERFYFDVTDPTNLPELALDAYVHNVKKSDDGFRSSDLGKVRITGASFVPFPDAIVMHYVLTKRQLLSHVKGTLALKVYITDDSSITASIPSEPHNIPLQHLKEITNNFSDEQILGRGGFGVVYKGVLQNGEMVAVKKILSSLMPGLQKKFENEVYHLMMLKHPNIVRCVGYCYEVQNACLKYNGKFVFAEMAERLLVLEYLPNGSLDKHISDESSGLGWSTRYKIIKGICYGLCHLHEQIDRTILHLDLKPANILIDEKMEPKITDFGLSRLRDQEQTICTSSRDGTFGYMAPEFLHGGIITPKSDIFSLGVIILEVITGHREYVDVTNTSPEDFTELALKKWRNVLKRTAGYIPLEMECQQIERCIKIGLICVSPERMERPPITEVINMIRELDCSISSTMALPVAEPQPGSHPGLGQQTSIDLIPKYEDLASIFTGKLPPTLSRLEHAQALQKSWLRHWTLPGIFKSTIPVDAMLKSLPKLSHQELQVACEDFSNIIVSPPETVVYKGTMKDGREFSLISSHAEGHWTSQQELFYKNKVIFLARLIHENIATFLGYCSESEPFYRMVAFEYSANGTLYEHLHYEEKAQISWDTRMKIAIGIAQGLRYLHTELQPPFALSELNSKSVYLTEDFTPKLFDFECCKMMFSKCDTTIGHLNQHADIQGNTFSFGVILLEIISGQLPYCKEKGYLVDWAMKYVQQPEDIRKLVDPELTYVRSEDLAVVCSVVSRCIDPDASKRPSMQIITGVLETGIVLSAAGIVKESSLAYADLALSLFNTFRPHSPQSHCECALCIYE